MNEGKKGKQVSPQAFEISIQYCDDWKS